ncbi:von Willebrand factor type A domain-containing protein [Clostridium cavendishii DSM 21758]|uniref:von Willebrand factor type A domain-containing protein n=1 Tax=Clostridium cavendishii DSM 21758 TaxID=1121302 RepID=A0A1M6CZQ4_9CLOT|nr:BatA and WFA domain-containing protein [Clostridium cavendishii]SHI66351.1 von Willebrand factor type A domain-containing protein [Clostridium cavendishii DSM 21758]
MRLWPLGFLILIPLLIILYILKQKSENQVVSSNLLWKEAYKNIEATTPWEKFRKNIMFFLQLVALLALIIALTNPFIKWGGKSYQNLILVIDNTGSMNSKYEGETRIKKAKELGLDYIKSLKSGGQITVISCGKVAKVEIASTKDKSIAEEKLKNIDTKIVSGDIKDSLSIIRSIGKQLESYEALVITDKEIDLSDINGRVISLGTKGKNAGIDLVAHKNVDNLSKVMVKVTNRGDSDYSSDVSLYGDDKLVDVKQVSLKPKESTSLYFDVKDFKGTYFKAELSEKDDLISDNSAYDIVKANNSKKVLLVTEKNVFLEKAFQTIDGIEVMKANSLDNVNSNDKYDLYVYDGVVPKEMPSSGNVMFINPSDNPWFKVSESLKGGEVNIVTDNLEISNKAGLGKEPFSVESYRRLNLTGKAKPFLKYKDEVLGFEGSYDGREICAIGFDLHKSDLGLKADFPILIHNLSSKLLDQGMLPKNNYYGGEDVEIKASSIGSDVTIKTPSGKTVKLLLKTPLKPFGETYEQGIYEVSQTVNSEVKKEKFTVNIKASEEGDMSSESQGEIDKRDKAIKDIRGGLELEPYLLLLAVIIIGAEWFYYKKGY